MAMASEMPVVGGRSGDERAAEREVLQREIDADRERLQHAALHGQGEPGDLYARCSRSGW